MCGIAASIGGESAAALLERAERGAARLTHRGPDGSGSLVLDGHVGTAVVRTGLRSATEPRRSQTEVERRPSSLAIAHRRLAILDPTDAGAQPMTSRDGRHALAFPHALAFNGEIYNYVELRAELEARGHRFESRTDTEVLLAACIEWGEGALERLVGMYAFLFVDLHEGTVLLARDPLGIKPLFLRERAGGVDVASELDALLAMDPEVAPHLDAAALWDYAADGVTDHRPRTMFAGVTVFPAGCRARLTLDRFAPVEAEPFWSLARGGESAASYPDSVASVRERFLLNVEQHLRSDVPVGCLLSGGVDSSAIVMAMREVGGPGLDIHTFSFVGEDEAIDEKPWIDEVVRAAGTIHHELRMDELDWDAELDALTRRQGQPFATLAVPVQAALFRVAAAAGVRVVLDGQGADEAFAGYRWAWSLKLADDLRAGRLWTAMRFLRGLHTNHRSPDPRARSVARTALRIATGRGRRAPRPDWLDVDWFLHQGLERQAPSHGATTLFERSREALTERGLPALLRFEDASSMASSVEARLPFVTPDLISLATSLPSDHLIDRIGTSKRVLRDALAGLVPGAVLERREKVGFSVPLASFPVRSAAFRARLARVAGAKPGGPFRGSYLAGLGEELERGVALRGVPLRVAWRAVGYDAWQQAFALEAHGLAPPG